MRTRRTYAGALALVLAAGVSLVGCSSPSSGSDSTTDGADKVSVDKELAAAVPAPIRDAGTITVVTDPTYPPFESIVGGEIVGLDADLAKKIGEVLGLKVEFEKASFDSIIPALQANQADMAMSSIGDTKERETAVDFTTAYWNGTLLLTAEGNPLKGTPTMACNMKVGVVRGSLQQNDFLPAHDDRCIAEGEKPPVPGVYQSSQQAVLALQSGRVDAVLADAPSVAEAAANNPGFEVVGPIERNPNPAGVAFPKGSELVEAVNGAINLLIENGEYIKILEKYDLGSIAIDESQINGAIE
ncbi:ABC transporter substrate-binding protein [Microbacterium esteraromaticum]|nr:ABC transporter substrate-binding protein [Microbacterium esteraromaticum]